MILVLAACSSVSQPPAGQSGRDASRVATTQSDRYSLQQDRAPTTPLNPSLIREVVPEPVARTMAGNRSPYTVNGRTYQVMATEEGFQQTGLASWYGEKFHGHLTSNGEIFDMYQVSAAHTSLPIPSFVRVTNLENQRSIIARVNDRGPFHDNRVIDMSYAAAYRLGFHNQGTALVHVEAVAPGQQGVILASASGAATSTPAVSASGRYLQAGAFSDLGAAQRLSDRLRSMTSRPVFIRSIEAAATRQSLHRVRVGPIADSGELQSITDSMLAAGLDEPYVVNE